MSTLSFHNFSWKGDPKWWNATRWTGYGPLVVCAIFAISIVQLVCGSIWIVQLGSNLSVPMIIQTLLLPGCSFFNALPSLHLHMLLRNNPPLMAFIFSSLFTILYLVSFIFSLAVCSPAPKHIPRGLRHAECPQGIPGGPEHGVSKAVWDTMLAFEFLSVVAYGVHGVMAGWVRGVVRGRERRGEVERLDPEEEEKRRERARELWNRNYRREGLWGWGMVGGDLYVGFVRGCCDERWEPASLYAGRSAEGGMLIEVELKGGIVFSHTSI